MTSARSALAGVDALLRGEGEYAVDRSRAPFGRLVLVMTLFAALYGAVMGAYAGRVEQALFSATKVPLLLLCASAVCLPNFYVVNSVLGLRDDFSAALRGVAAAQATLAVTLAALAPVTVLAYVSLPIYRHALLWNGVVFAIATVAGQRTLARHYAPLVRKDPRHQIARAVWAVLYVFVAIQLAWVLRPFVGDPSLPARFLRDDAWSNAYVVVFRDVLRLG